MNFKLKSPYQPKGDQPKAIKKLTRRVEADDPHSVLLGVTGSGKTFTVANVIENVQKPTLIISHNKTLAAQLYQEFKELFPQNAVGFFVSYYDYYIPESYIPQTDTYIAKETDINEEIDKLRLQATSNLFTRDDVIIVASVSCIYNLGSPTEYRKYVVELEKGLNLSQEDFLYKLVHIHYRRSNMDLTRGQFRVRGNKVEVFPAYQEQIVSVYFKDKSVCKITIQDQFAGERKEIDRFLLYPAKHYLTQTKDLDDVFQEIREDMITRTNQLKKQGKLVEAQRLEQRVTYDLEMIKEVGYVNGIENYSRYFDERGPGDPPNTLIDYFKHVTNNNFLTVIDESHITVPQIKGMYRGDRARKQNLINFGFRLPSCLDNRPLKFNEFQNKVPQTIYVSATPAEWERNQANGEVVEQIIRPTGLVDPEIEVRQTAGQIPDLIDEILKRKKKNQRVLVTTLTKKLAEELARFLADPENTQEKIKVQYLHAEIDTLERTEILASLRKGEFDVVVGINLLREGLDLPEVSLVAILDADQQGFLRSRTSLIQTMGRAARNRAGQVIMYAEEKSAAMKEAIEEVRRRREIQLEYNEKHNITPKTIKKPVRKNLVQRQSQAEQQQIDAIEADALTPKEKKELVPRLKRKMRLAARELDFEKAAKIRDKIEELKN
jgi:excinuclease ABC subunit B